MYEQSGFGTSKRMEINKASGNGKKEGIKHDEKLESIMIWLGSECDEETI